MLPPREWIEDSLLAGALESTSVRQQEVLYLRNEFELTQSEVGEILGIRQEAVGRHERTAHETLRRLVPVRGSVSFHPYSSVEPVQYPSEYTQAIEKLLGEIELVKKQLRKSPSRELRRKLYTLYVHRGQLKRIAVYLVSRERYIIDTGEFGVIRARGKYTADLHGNKTY